MRKFLILIFSFFLVSCDGFDINSTDNLSEDSDQVFSSPELSFGIRYSSLILNDSGFNNREGFIVLFDSTEDLTEIELRSNDDDSALVGTYPWEIDDDKLVVTYPNGVQCTSTKTSEISSQIEANSSCSGGQPRNAQIRNTLIEPNLLDVDNLSNKSITIENENDDYRINFFSNGDVNIIDIDSDGDEVPSTKVDGRYENSNVYNNIAINIQLEDSNETRLLILLNGGLNSGTVMELRFTTTTLPTATSILNSVYIHSTGENDNWDTESVYDDIRFDPFDE